MPNGQIQRPKPEKIVIKDDLEEQRTMLHNLRHNVLIQEAVVKKLEELAR